MSDDRTAEVKGKIVGFVRNEILAVIQTDIGKAYLDINDTLDYRLKIGDEIEVEEAGWYILNGQVVTVLGDRYRLNGNWHTITD